jgi:hypothetical protein
MILTKKEFKDVLNFIYKKNKQEDAFCTLLENMTPDHEIVPAFIYAGYADTIIRLLEVMFEDKKGDIFHFMYDLDGLKHGKDGIPTEFCPYDKDKKTVLYKDVDSLYDYLIRNKIN